jgi:5-methylcytosine-specific restriction endonuclease McrA
MPYKNKADRPYKKEYDEYHSTPEQKRKRAMRNTARRRKERDGDVSKGDGKDVDHKKPLSKGGSNAPSNTRVVSKSANRSFPRKSNGKPK